MIQIAIFICICTNLLFIQSCTNRPTNELDWKKQQAVKAEQADLDLQIIRAAEMEQVERERQSKVLVRKQQQNEKNIEQVRKLAEVKAKSISAQKLVEAQRLQALTVAKEKQASRAVFVERKALEEKLEKERLAKKKHSTVTTGQKKQALQSKKKNPNKSVKKQKPVNPVATPSETVIAKTNNSTVNSTATQNAEPMTLATLPISFSNGWSLDRKPNPVTMETECLLSSQLKFLFDGYEKTKVQLYISRDVVYFKAKSNLDLTYKNVGIQIGSENIVNFEGLQGELSAYVRKNYTSVSDPLRTGEKITVHMGFWPSWPITETRSVSFDSRQISDALFLLKKCNSM